MTVKRLREHPILFKPPMARAIGNTKPGVWPAEPIDPSKPFKWQTRRVVKLREFQRTETPGYDWIFRDRRALWNDFRHDDLVARHCPYGKPGDLLWAKETAELITVCGFNVPGAKMELRYVAGGRRWFDRDAHGTAYETKRYGLFNAAVPSLFMPRWASRFNLRVMEVRVQRLEEIRHEDAMAEGCMGFGWVASSPYISGPHTDDGELPREEYERLWNEINAGRGHPWIANDWVWAISFMRES